MATYIVNLRNGSVTTYPENSSTLLLETGFIDLKNISRPTDVYIQRKDTTPITFAVTSYNGKTFEYITDYTKINLGKGIKSRFIKFGIKSTLPQNITSFKINVIGIKRNV